MSSTRMVATWRRYTAAEKKAYRARVRRRYETRHALKSRIFMDIYSGQTPDSEILAALNRTSRHLADTGLGDWHFFADGFGSRVPTARLNGDVL
jgi:hypothetical protein